MAQVELLSAARSSPRLYSMPGSTLDLIRISSTVQCSVTNAVLLTNPFRPKELSERNLDFRRRVNFVLVVYCRKSVLPYGCDQISLFWGATAEFTALWQACGKVTEVGPASGNLTGATFNLTFCTVTVKSSFKTVLFHINAIRKFTFIALQSYVRVTDQPKISCSTYPHFALVLQFYLKVP